VRTDYPELFAVISTLYGAADSTHFNLPDLRGVGVRGWDHGRGVDLGAASRVTPTATWAGSDKTGATAADGDHVGTEQNDQMQGHYHKMIRANGTEIYVLDTKDLSASGSSAFRTSDGTSNNAVGDAKTDGTNGTPRTGSETRSRNVAMMYIIKQ
jgi:microcystin-dependent protein